MAAHSVGGRAEEVKTQFLTREGCYNLLPSADYSKPKGAAFGPQGCGPVNVSFVTVRDAEPHNARERLCYSVGKELYFYVYKGIYKSASPITPIDKRLYKGTIPTCHDCNEFTASTLSCALLVGFSAGQVQLLDPMGREQSKIFNEERSIDKTRVTCIKWVPASKNYFLVSHASGCMYAYNAELACYGGGSGGSANGTPTPSYQTVQAGDGFTVQVCRTSAIAPGRSPAVGGVHPRVNPLYKWTIGDGAVNSFRFSPCARYLAVVGQDGCMRVFEYSTLRLVGMMRSYFGGLHCVAWSPDGKFIATGGEDDLITVYSFDEHRVVCRGRGHQSWVVSVAFDPYAYGDQAAVAAAEGSDEQRPPKRPAAGELSPPGSCDAGGGGGVARRPGEADVSAGSSNGSTTNGATGGAQAPLPPPPLLDAGGAGCEAGKSACDGSGRDAAAAAEVSHGGKMDGCGASVQPPSLQRSEPAEAPAAEPQSPSARQPPLPLAPSDHGGSTPSKEEDAPATAAGTHSTSPPMTTMPTPVGVAAAAGAHDAGPIEGRATSAADEGGSDGRGQESCRRRMPPFPRTSSDVSRYSMHAVGSSSSKDGCRHAAYRLGSVGQDTLLCLWDLTDEVLRAAVRGCRASSAASASGAGEPKQSDGALPDGGGSVASVSAAGKHGASNVVHPTVAAGSGGGGSTDTVSSASSHSFMRQLLLPASHNPQHSIQSTHSAPGGLMSLRMTTSKYATLPSEIGRRSKLAAATAAPPSGGSALRSVSGSLAAAKKEHKRNLSLMAGRLSNDRRQSASAKAAGSARSAQKGGAAAASSQCPLGSAQCPRLSDVPIVEPHTCKKVANEMLSCVHFLRDCIVTASHDGVISTWVRPGRSTVLRTSLTNTSLTNGDKFGESTEQEHNRQAHDLKHHVHRTSPPGQLCNGEAVGATSL